MNKRTIFTVLAALLLINLSFGQNAAYTMFNKKGKETKYKKLVKEATKADVVLFGELHNNPIAHWLQLELFADMHAVLDSNLVMGAEMFEADGQLIMDEYFTGMIGTKKFEDEMRLWNNYKTDYKPLVEFAKDSGLHFVATNIPRRYANMVFNLGIDTLNSLTDLALTYMMPLPLDYDITLDSYAALAGGGDGPMAMHGNSNFRDAQAVKDATMSHFILKNLSPEKTFIHFNGAYHSDKYEGIYYFLKKAMPDLNIVTISTVSQDEVKKLEEENAGKADFIIAVPENMTKTY